MYGATAEDQENNFVSRQPSAHGQPVRADVKQSARAYRPRESTRLHNEKSESQRIPSTVYILAACAAVNSCNLGYDLGINTDAGPLLKADLGLSDRQYELFNGILSACSALGCMCTSTISDNYGRRATFIVANLTMFFGVFFVSMARSYQVLLVARGITGFGIGLGLAIDPLYIAEIAPSRYRGWLVSWSEIAITFGVFGGAVVGWSFKTLGADHWRAMFAIGLVTPVLMLTFVATVMLESPRWLLLKGRDEEAEEVISRVIDEDDDVGRTKQEIKISLIDEANAYNANSWLDVLFPSGPLKWMLIVGVLSGIAQQIAGIEPILFYNQFLFERAGETSLNNLALYPIIFNGVKVAATICAGPMLDRYGRRPMMVMSFSGMAVCCVVLALLFSWHFTPVWLIVVLISMWFGFFGCGAGPGCWLLTGELFSTTVRAKGVSITSTINRLVAAFELSTTLSFVAAFGVGSAFTLLATAMSLYAVFFYTILPETAGETLEEIADTFCTMDKNISGSQLREGFAHRREDVPEDEKDDREKC